MKAANVPVWGLRQGLQWLMLRQSSAYSFVPGSEATKSDSDPLRASLSY